MLARMMFQPGDLGVTPADWHPILHPSVLTPRNKYMQIAKNSGLDFCAHKSTAGLVYPDNTGSNIVLVKI